MAAKRPVTVTVIAILNFLMGGLGLLCSLCGSASEASYYITPQSAQQAQPAQPGQPPKLDIIASANKITKMTHDIPGYTPAIVAKYTVDLVVSVGLIVGGLGLLGMKQWGRVVTMICVIISVLAAVGWASFHLTAVLPVAVQGAEELQKAMNPNAPPPPAGLNQVTQGASPVCGAMFPVIYALAVLIFLNLPNVRKAFAGGGYDPGTGDDYDRDRDDRGPRDRDDDREDYRDRGEGFTRGDDR